MNKYKKYASLLSAVGLLLLVVGVTYSFFNYTRTGAVNLLSTGTINFTSNYEGVTLQNVFPISSDDVDTDTNNVASFDIDISGNTTYNGGIEYLVTIDELDNELKDILTFEIDSTNLGTKVSTEDYFNNRGSSSMIAKYKKIRDNNYMTVGYIKENTIGVNGSINIKAYVDIDKVAITDTEDENTSWINGRKVMSTSEWNDLSSTGISFKVKVEANEGIWVLPSIEDVNIMGEFSSIILANKSDVKEIYFEEMTQTEIDTRYASATVKDDIAIEGTVLCWLEGNKLYVASPDTIYLSTGNALFASTYNTEKLEFNNVDTRMVTNMEAMFLGYNGHTLDLTAFDTTNVTNMSYMFSDCRHLIDLDVSSFNTINVNNMLYMFDYNDSMQILDISNFDTSNVTNMSLMFNGCKNLQNIIGLTSFDTTNVTNMNGMFQGCESITILDLSSFDTSKVTGIFALFSQCNSLSTVFVSNHWTTNMVSNEENDYVFGSYLNNYTTNLVGGEGTIFDSNHIDAEYARIDDPANGKPGYFTYKAYSGA